MAKVLTQKTESQGGIGYGDLSHEKLLGMYRIMYTSRRIDDKEILLRKKGEVFFQISGAGHEAVLVAAAMVLRAGYDWFFPYYRDRALCLGLGITPYEMFLQAVGAEEDPSSRGRQMPSHFGSKKFNIVSQSSPTGTQFLGATGCAEATYRYNRLREAAERCGSFHADEITYVSSGDGTTSQGEFWESVNTAANLRLPILYLVEDNGYAISVPVDVQTPGGSISDCLGSVPGLRIERCDGTDPLESYTVIRQLEAHLRAGRGPCLLHATVTRPYGHSMTDDVTKYRTKEELEEENAADCIPKFARFLIANGYATEAELERIRRVVDAEINAAAEEAVRAKKPEGKTAKRWLYSEARDPSSREFETEPELSGEPLKMSEALNRTLLDEFGRDPLLLAFGEDVADASHEEKLKEVKGKGGVFGVTHGLQMQSGKERVYNTPLAEASIVGRAVGLALRGWKPVAEIQFFDYIWPAMMQIRSEVCTMRWRSANQYSCPMVIRVAIGGYLRGGAIWHSQCGETIFAHCPGMRIAYPSTALDAVGLLRTAIRCDDPVLFCEHKHLYNQAFNRSPYPGSEFMIPFGRGRIVRRGKSLTVVTYGEPVFKAAEAAEKLAKEGIEAEIIDLRTLQPYDWEMIAESVRRTARCLVLHEDTLSFGYGAEIASRVADELFEYLDAPVRRCAALDTWVGYSPPLEEAILPQSEDIAEACRSLARY